LCGADRSPAQFFRRASGTKKLRARADRRSPIFIRRGAALRHGRFSEELAERHVVERLVSHQPLQPPVLILELLEAADLLPVFRSVIT
jgi:hypothetical protein